MKFPYFQGWLVSSYVVGPALRSILHGFVMQKVLAPTKSNTILQCNELYIYIYIYMVGPFQSDGPPLTTDS